MKLLLVVLLLASQTPNSESAETPTSALLECLSSLGNMFCSGKPTALQLAALEGDIDAIRKSIANPTDDPCSQSQSLLPFAAVGGHPEIVKLLLADRVDPAVQSEYSMDTPVPPRKVARTPREAVLACSAIDPATPLYATVIALLEEAEMAIQDRSKRAEAALLAEDIETVKSILREGPIFRGVGAQIVGSIVKKGQVDVLRSLYEVCKGDSLATPPELSRLQEKHPSGLSASENFLRNREIKFWSDLLIYNLREKGPAPANVLNKLKRNSTLLMHAAQYGQLELVKALLEAGADPGIKNLEGKKALDLACTMSASNDCEEIQRLLEKYD